MNSLAPAFARAAANARAPRVAAASAYWVRDDRFLWAVGGMIWVLLLLMIIPDRFAYGDLATAIAPGSGGWISRLLWVALLGGGTLIIVWRLALAWALAQRLNFFLLAFVLLAAASVAWSADPGVTARRLIRIVTIVAATTGFVLIGWHERRFQNVLRPIITAVLAASVVFGLGWPDLAIHQEVSAELIGAWHGLATHKNGFGNIACVGLIFWSHAWMSKQMRLLPALAGGGLAAACLYLSRSSTSLVAAVFTLLFLAMVLRTPRAWQRFMPYVVVLFVGALVAYSLALLQVVPGLHTLLSPIGAITGKDMSFTGRTEIWDILGEHIAQHPLLGTGYGAYWTGISEGSPSYDFVRRMSFYPASAHNGYLEVLNDLGALGLTLLIGYLATFVVQSLRLLRTERAQAALYLALFLQAALTNLSESHWFSVLSVDFVIMTLATVALARSLLERRLRGAHEAAR